jgi:uncharacterized protein (TIGR02611 family)
MNPPEGMHPKLKLVWKIISISVGVLMILAGLVMLVTPGPGWLFIFAGLAVLGPHSRTARRVTTWLKEKLRIHHKQPGEETERPLPAKNEDHDRRARM